MSNFFNYFDKGWDIDIFFLFCSLNSEKRWLLIKRQESLNHEVLIFTDETLTELLEMLSGMISALLAHFNKLSCGNLSFLYNTFIVLENSHFMTVDKSIVFSDFAYEIFCIFASFEQKYFFNLENLFFDTLRCFHIKLTRFGCK